MPSASKQLPCQGCNRPSLVYCALCSRTPYCSDECSKENWPFHRSLCFSMIDPPGVIPAPPLHPSVQMLVNAIASLELPAAAPSPSELFPASTVAANLSPAPTVAASLSPARTVAASEVRKDNTTSLPASPRSKPAPSVLQGWESYEKLSDTEFTKVLVTTAGSQELWVNVFSNGPSIVQLHADLEAAAETFLSCVPTVGQCYAGCYEGEWCRVKVTAVTPTLKVHYLDYGNEEVLSLRNMRTLPGPFRNFPAQAVRIRIAGAVESKHAQFKTDSVMFVKRVATAADGCVEVVIEGDEPATPPEIPVQELPSDKFAQVVVLESGPTSMVVNLSSQGSVMANLSKGLARVIGSLPRVTAPVVGQLVAAEFADDSGTGWYRARVIGCSPLRVLFLDFGNEVEVPAGGTKTLPAEFWALPAQAVPVKLAPSSAQRFQALPMYATLRVRAVGKVDGFVIVEPEDLEAKEPVCANAASAVVDDGNPRLACLMPAPVVPGFQEDLFWVYRQGPEGFVQKVDPTNKLLSLTEPMKAAAEGTTLSAAVVGAAVLAFFEGEWARAVVVSVSPELRIRYLDYGNETAMTLGDLRPMPTALSQIPALCWKVRLSADSAAAIWLLEDFSVFRGTFISQEADSVWTLRGEPAQ